MNIVYMNMCVNINFVLEIFRYILDLMYIMVDVFVFFFYVYLIVFKIKF